MTTLHAHDASATLTTTAAVDRYLIENGFTRAEYTAKSVPIKLGPVTFQMPNGQARQRAIALHDIHHALTGYGTDLIGEAEIAAWELRGGCTNAFLWAINLGAVAAGLCVSPRRVLAAFGHARGATTLYRMGVTADEIGSVTVAELRRRVGVAPGGLADRAERKLAWGADASR